MPQDTKLSPPEELLKMFPHRYRNPEIASSAFVAPGVHVIGDVVVGDFSSIWFGCVVRGDVNYIRIGSRTNIQDCSLVHVSYQTHPVEVGDNVTIGHSVVLHGCKVASNSLIGMGSVLLDGAEIGEFVLLGAGSLVTPNTKIPSGSKAFGRPAKVVGELTPEERARITWNAEHYVNLSKTYR